MRRFKSSAMQRAYDKLRAEPIPVDHYIHGAMQSAYRQGYLHPKMRRYRILPNSLAYAAWAAGVDNRKADMNDKPFVAHQNMKEFDPECELHFPLIIVKAVEPGCTTEIQIENARTGEVIRLTTTDSREVDDVNFRAAVLDQFTKAWDKYE